MGAMDESNGLPRNNCGDGHTWMTTNNIACEDMAGYGGYCLHDFRPKKGSVREL